LISLSRDEDRELSGICTRVSRKGKSPGSAGSHNGRSP
jgi:hypothetical protein